MDKVELRKAVYIPKEMSSMYSDHLYTTLVELIHLPSTSGHEENIRAYLAQYLSSLGLNSQVDGSGNLVAALPGEGTPLLLNAHMDRVPPGLGHQPILRDGILYSDDATNLGADDAAGRARNAIPASLSIEGEMRSFEPPAAHQQYKQAIQESFEQTAHRFGGSAKISFRTHSSGYEISPAEPLLQAYRSVLARRGATL